MLKLARSKIRDFYKGLNCRLFGHKYKLIKAYKTNRKEFSCINCGGQYTTDPDGNISPLTQKRRRLNEAMELFYNKKSSNPIDRLGCNLWDKERQT